MRTMIIDEYTKQLINEKLNIDMNNELFSPTVDFAFKRIFTADEKRSKIALIDFINSIMEFEKDSLITELTVINPEIAVTGQKQKKSIFDIRAKNKAGEQIIIEMQAKSHAGFAKRSQYTIAKTYTSQDLAGLNYNALKKCYLISVVNFKLTDAKDFISDYRFRDRAGNDLSDDETIVFIELAKLDKVLEKPVEEQTNAEMWALFLKFVTDASKREILEKIIERKEAIGMAATILRDISMDEQERILYENELLAELDFNTGIEDARKDGFEKGIEKGIIKAATSMIINGLDKEFIMKVTDLSDKVVQDLIDKINKNNEA